MVEDKIETALAWMADNRNVALATVISIRGSSPWPVGSQLVVDDRGAFEGSVSGGCIETTIITEAQFSISENRPQRLSLGIEIGDDLDWDTVLACGGGVEIFVENITPYRGILERLMILRRDRKKACLITHLESGTKQLLVPDKPGPSAALPSELITTVDRVFANGNSTLVSVDNQPYFLQVFTPPPQLIIIGAVHIAQTLTIMARLVDYQVTIIDPRTAFATVDRFPGTELIRKWPENALEHIPLHEDTAMVVLSHSPKLDDPALIRALESDVFYIGALGSQKTHGDRLSRLKAHGFSEEQLQRIHSPVGLKIGGRTPAEIAISIMAEITQVRNMS
ncbi:MAG: XdhC family protein [Deltaproteobacteria bacterium]|nr:XdhC family protein [Deltaproteobacteria bacterium]